MMVAEITRHDWDFIWQQMDYVEGLTAVVQWWAKRKIDLVRGEPASASSNLL